MALTIYENKEAGGGGNKVKLDRRLWLTREGDLVEDGHPEAATLYGSPGKEVRRSVFEALGGKVKDEPQGDGLADESRGRRPASPVASPVAPKPEAPAVKPTPKPRRKTKRKTKKKGK